MAGDIDFTWPGIAVFQFFFKKDSVRQGCHFSADSDDVFCHGDGSGGGMLSLGGITDVEILLVQIK